MNKYVTQTIANFVSAGFTVKAWADDEYFPIEEIDDYATFSIVAIDEHEVELGGIFITTDIHGDESISDYTLALEEHVARNESDLDKPLAKTKTSLVCSVSIVEAPRDSITLLSVYGPKLFKSYVDAKAHLFKYVTNRINANPDPFMHDSDFDVKPDPDELLTMETLNAWFAALNESAKDNLVEWYFANGTDEEVIAEYSIDLIEVN